MPVIEYMFTINERGRREVPGYVADRGYHYNPADHTYLGWLNDNRDFWVPDTIEVKTKADCVTRALAMHSADPFMVMGDDGDFTETAMTTEEVTTMIEDWYDMIVANNT